MPEFISRTCQKCGGNLEPISGNRILRCAYCGTEYDNKLQAFIHCPECNQPDMVVKIAALVRADPSYENRLPFPIKPAQPVLEPLPHPPSPPASSTPPRMGSGGCLRKLVTGLVIFTGLSLLIGSVMGLLMIVFVFPLSGRSPSPTEVLVAVVTLGVSLLVIIITIPIYKGRNRAEHQKKMSQYQQETAWYQDQYAHNFNFYQQEAARVAQVNEARNTAYQASLDAWRRERHAFEDLYYCKRDDIILTPDNRAVPVRDYKTRL